jgi:hypothetical protein
MQQTINSQTTQMKMTKISTTTSGLTVGLDLGDRGSPFCLLDAAGQIQQEGRIRSTRSAFQARFGALAPARLALETGPHSLWAGTLLMELGHEVIVAHVREVRAMTLCANINETNSTVIITEQGEGDDCHHEPSASATVGSSPGGFRSSGQARTTSFYSRAQETHSGPSRCGRRKG